MIKINIDMPMTCEQCRFYDSINYDGNWCLAKYSQVSGNTFVEREADCPLVEEKTGEWIRGEGTVTCPNCESIFNVMKSELLDYCAWCGMRMHGIGTSDEL